MMFEWHFSIAAGIFLFVLVVARLLARGTDPPQVRRNWPFQLAIATAAGLLGLAALWVVEHFFDIHFLAGGAAPEPATWWISCVYFLAMVVGMVAQTVWNAIDKRSAGKPPTFDRWEFVKPALVAPIVFIAVYQKVSEAHLTTMMLFFSFQNGFFWQTVLRSRKR